MEGGHSCKVSVPRAVDILCLLYQIKYITTFPPSKLINVHATLD